MCRLSCPVCNPIARRRRRKFLQDVEAAGHIEFFRRLAEETRSAKQ